MRRVCIGERGGKIRQRGHILPGHVAFSGAVKLLKSGVRTVGLAGHVGFCIGSGTLCVAVVRRADRRRVHCKCASEDSGVGTLLKTEVHGISALSWFLATERATIDT